MKLKSLEILKSNKRITSIDIFRGIAIITVVLFHFGYLKFGYLGVDLFFVISGLLVGGILTRQFKEKGRVNYLKFFIQRGGKIWPSYYTFLIFGTALAYLFYYNTPNNNQIIPFWDFKRYLFFYQNYTGLPLHWSFDHVWSICVEEHFYFLLPFMFIVVRIFHNNDKLLFIFTVLTIILGIVFKYISLKYTNSHDTYSGTQNRIDALAWGVLLNLLLVYRNKWVKNFRFKKIISFLGFLLLVALIYFFQKTESELYKKVLFQSLVPVSFFLMIFGLYYMDFSRLFFIRLIAYYSYNWYLWHPIFVHYISDKFGHNMMSLTIYLIVTFATAILFTILVEEPMLSYRKKILKKIKN